MQPIIDYLQNCIDLIWRCELNGSPFSSIRPELEHLLIQLRDGVVAANLSSSLPGFSETLSEIIGAASLDHVSPREIRLRLERIASSYTDILARATHGDEISNFRISIINYLIKRFSYRTYLEIGCAGDYCFTRIDIPSKVGVDPTWGGTHRMTSDDFFAQNKDSFDIVFIDGLHEATQVAKDAHNALRVLNDNGTIVFHDCNPQFEVRQLSKMEGVWNGDVWKALVHLRTLENVDVAVVNMDYGCGVLRVRPNRDPISLQGTFEELTWKDLVLNRQPYLNLMDFQSLERWL